MPRQGCSSAHTSCAFSMSGAPAGGLSRKAALATGSMSPVCRKKSSKKDPLSTVTRGLLSSGLPADSEGGAVLVEGFEWSTGQHWLSTCP